MSAMAEVIDESIRNMTSNMVTKADQEKVRMVICTTSRFGIFMQPWLAPLYTTSGLCTNKVRTAADGEE
jgi:hypothetical protein